MSGRGIKKARSRPSEPGANSGPAGHVPVLLSSVLEALQPKNGEIYVDGTFGAGGYSRAILDAADCQLIAIDCDPVAAFTACAFTKEYGDRFSFIPGRFGDLQELIKAHGVSHVDGVVLDVGVSSMQIDDPARGFSFAHDGPLDMRMSCRGLSAADVVNQYSQADIARIIAALGEERRARVIARAIVSERENKPITTTLQLADLVTSVIGRRPGAAKHPATRSFQALRIYVNRELEELARGLAAIEQLLSPGGRAVIVSFHSLEDRIVKQFFNNRAIPKSRPSRHLPDSEEDDQFKPSFTLVNKRTITPSREEQSENPRARSSRLRAATRLDAPAFAFSLDELKIPRTPDPDARIF
ncbi:MAG: 16S rRNA (cytosine(1402)-N(4))-methyltransferase RsmH [bacterium]|nr:16S rRNA (cytosine(1402)-N(4))-methyltransferase RsmH [bacterium]